MTFECPPTVISAPGAGVTGMDDEAPNSPPSYWHIVHVTDPKTDGNLSDGALLQSNEQHIMQQIRLTIGSRRVSIGRLEFAPNWIIDKEIESELQNSWKDAFKVFPFASNSADPKAISSHFVFNISEEVNNNLKLEARLVLHGLRDKYRFSIRCVSSSADLSIARMVIHLSWIFGFDLATADVRCACMLSGTISRDIHMRHPSILMAAWCRSGKYCPYHTVSWKLKGNGCVQSTTGWYETLRQSAELEQNNISKAGIDGWVALIFAKVVDKFLLAGTTGAQMNFCTS